MVGDIQTKEFGHFKLALFHRFHEKFHLPENEVSRPTLTQTKSRATTTWVMLFLVAVANYLVDFLQSPPIAYVVIEGD